MTRRIREAADTATTPVTEARDIIEPGAGQLLEAIDADADHENDRFWRWRVTMIQPGISRNGYRYRPEVLREAASRYEGLPAHDGHRSDATRRSSPVSTIVGFHENVTSTPTGALESDFQISRNAPHIRDLFRSAFDANRPELIGFSHDAEARVRQMSEGGRSFYDVTSIVRPHSVDVVADPSAGGRLERLVAGGDENDDQEGAPIMDAASLAELLGITEAEAQTIIDEGRVQEALATRIETAAGTTTEPPADPEPQPSVAIAETTISTTAPAPVGPPRYEAGSLEQNMMITEALRGVALPEAAASELRTRIGQIDTTGSEIARMVAETATIYESIAAATGMPLPGQGDAGGTVQIAQDEYDRKVLALEALIRGTDVQDADGTRVQPYTSLRQAYFDFTGRHEHNLPGSASVAEWMLAESVGAIPEAAAQRLTEAVLTTTWSSAMGETLHRILISEYQNDPLNNWQRLVSANSPITDFKTQRRNRIGGFDVLPTVNENAAYTALTTPAEEEASYSLTKYGGTEVVTLEAMANDDIQALRRVPFNMARAAAVTIANAIWVTTIEGNVNVSYEAVALFDAGHSNTTAVALGEAGMNTLRTAMVGQQRLGETSGVIGVQPMALVVPSELWLTGVKLTRSAFAQASGESDGGGVNAFQGLDLIEVPLLTDANDWFLIADPRSVPMIEMGWWQGRRDPEILVQDQPQVGAVFTNDRTTYKVRHIWSFVILDHRGFQRGTQV